MLQRQKWWILQGRMLYVPPGYACVLWDPELYYHGVCDRARQAASEQLGIQPHWKWRTPLPKAEGWGTLTPKILYSEDDSLPCVQLHPASYKPKRDKETIQKKTVSTQVSSPGAAGLVHSSVGNSSSTYHIIANADNFQRRKQNYLCSSVSWIENTFLFSEEKLSD